MKCRSKYISVQLLGPSSANYLRFEATLIAVKKRKNQKQFLINCLEEQVCPKKFGFHKFGNTLGYSFPDYIKSFLEDRIKICSIECDSAYFSLRCASRNLRFLCPDNTVYNSVVQFLSLIHI